MYIRKGYFPDFSGFGGCESNDEKKYLFDFKELYKLYNVRKSEIQLDLVA